MYENAVDDYACDWLMNMFESNLDKTRPGVIVTNGILEEDASIKSSTDWAIDLDNEGHFVINAIVMQSLALCIEEYKDVYTHLKRMTRWSTVPDYNIQRYLPGQGFRKQHCEHGPHNPYLILAWMIYLNDVEDGGTDFPYINMQLNAKKGNIAIWPAGFTHIHAGIISETTTKYIVTGWFQIENSMYEQRRKQEQERAEIKYPRDPDWAENIMPSS